MSKQLDDHIQKALFYKNKYTPVIKSVSNPSLSATPPPVTPPLTPFPISSPTPPPLPSFSPLSPRTEAPTPPAQDVVSRQIYEGLRTEITGLRAEFAKTERVLKAKISDVEGEQEVLKKINTDLTAQLAVTRAESEEAIREKDTIINELRNELVTTHTKSKEITTKNESAIIELQRQLEVIKLEAETAKKDKEEALKKLSMLKQTEDEEGNDSDEEPYSETPQPFGATITKPPASSPQSSSLSSSSSTSSLTVSISGGSSKQLAASSTEGELLYNDERATLGEDSGESYEIV